MMLRNKTPKTLHDKFVAALLAQGHALIANDPRGSGKYTRLFRKNITRGDKQIPTYYYVGRSGALRAGINIASSVPVSDKFKASLLADPSVEEAGI